MGLIFTGKEGVEQMNVNGAPFDLDSVWSLYTEAHNREYQLTKAGYNVRRTEMLDVGGKLSKRGIDTMLYAVWIRRGRVQKTPGRRPKK